MFTVLEMAPVMNGCTAAIISTCACQGMKRVPRRPERLAVSNTG